MTIQEAIKSGKDFKRKSWDINAWAYLNKDSYPIDWSFRDDALMDDDHECPFIWNQLKMEDVLATDWITKDN